MLARRFVLLVAVFVAGASGLPGAEVPPADMDVDMEEEEVRTLFASLSDDSFALREEAMLRLSKMGRGSCPRWRDW